MTNQEKIRHILRKHKDTKFNRADFFIKYMEEYLDVAFYITYPQFRAFWKEEAALERSLRDILKENEFKLPPEQDSLRYQKANLFRENLSPKNKKDFNEVFNEPKPNHTNIK